MKKIVFGLLMTMGMLNAQNNLVFNKALNFRLAPGQTATVPDGKVWKIESYQRDGAGGISVSFEIQDPEYGSAISYGSYSSTPIWLQEGTILKAPSDGIFFSVLEFNVVPTSTGTGSGSGGGGVSSDGLVFSQMINEAIVVQPTNNTGTILYSFEVPVGHVYKVLHLSNNKWNSTYSEYQGGAADIFISQNGEPINPNRPTLSGDSLFLKEGNYDVVYYTGPNNSSTNEYSYNRLYIHAIDYVVP